MIDQPDRPTICLNMIVKNESHVIHEVLEAVAPYITYWVIVDTGSTDGTQSFIRAKMAELGIPGELHEEPWHDFGYNRTQALQLAQGHCDYIWVMDADDTVVGTPDFRRLSADGYAMLLDDDSRMFWRLQLFRDGVAWRYTGVLHEFALCDEPHTQDRLVSDYRILSRRTGSRSADPEKYRRDEEILRAQVEAHPEDTRSTFYLARTYEWRGDYANAQLWYAKRSEMPGWDEEIYCSLYKVAEMMEVLGRPWSDVMEAYLRAWQFRSSRPEPLVAVARHYRLIERYELGYLFASRAAQIPFPDDDFLTIVNTSQWVAMDEQAVCASWIGRQSEALELWRKALTRDDVPEEDRRRLIGNRDLMAVQLIATCADYEPDQVMRPAPRRDAEVVITIEAETDRNAAERTLNSFLHCCVDSVRAGRFLLVDSGLALFDRIALHERYPFLDFITLPGFKLESVRQEVSSSRYWLHLPRGWRFFAQEKLLARLIDVLESEPHVYQVGVNLGDARKLGPSSPARTGVKTTSRGNRYVLTDKAAVGPALFDTTRLHQFLYHRAGEEAFTPATATLDEVLCTCE